MSNGNYLTILNMYVIMIRMLTWIGAVVFLAALELFRSTWQTKTDSVVSAPLVGGVTALSAGLEALSA